VSPLIIQEPDGRHLRLVRTNQGGAGLDRSEIPGGPAIGTYRFNRQRRALAADDDLVTVETQGGGDSHAWLLPLRNTVERRRGKLVGC